MEIKKLDIRFGNNRKGEPFKKHTKLYVFNNGETILENLVNRRNKPYEVYQKELIPLVLERIKTENPNLFNQINNKKWKWTQSCGCSMCPCSPGFYIDNYSPYDIYVTI